MAYQAAEIGWNDAQIYSLICDADDRWGKYRDRSDRDLQRSNIVEKARRKHPYSEVDVTFAGLRESAKITISPQTVYSYREFRKLELHIEWVFEDLLAGEGYGIFFGESGVGKTQLILQMVRAIATGADFLGYKNSSGTPRKVIFFSLEMGSRPLKWFTDKMELDLSEEELALCEEWLDIVPLGEAMSLNRDEGRKFFESIIKEKKPELVFIDSLGAMREGTLNDDAAANDLQKYIMGFKKAYSCGVVVVHHANKQVTGSDLTLKDFFGSQYLYSGTDFVIGAQFNSREDDSILRLVDCKMRLGRLRASRLVYRTSNLTFAIQGGVSAVQEVNFRGLRTGSSEPFSDF